MRVWSVSSGQISVQRLRWTKRQTIELALTGSEGGQLVKSGQRTEKRFTVGLASKIDGAASSEN
jgi:hypothetical protein